MSVIQNLANRSILRDFFDELIEKGDEDAIFYTCKTLSELQETYLPDTTDFKILKRLHQDVKFLTNTNYPKSLLKKQIKTHFENYGGEGLAAILIALGQEPMTTEYDQRLENLEKRVSELENRFPV